MRVDKYRVIGELIETNKRQFVIPVYQRNYDWKKENCKKLYDDVIASAKKQKFHFLGSIVYVDMGEKDKIYRYLIIDGQQRITTIFIMMKALFDISNDNNTKEKINDILFNNDKYQELSLNEQTKIKLKPIKSDNEQLLHLFNNEFDEIAKNSQIYVNYVYLKQLILSSINCGMTCDEILDGLKWLTSAVIVLKTEDGDDPQVVFESINSTGVPLSLADLIRNYVLMTDKNQDKLFENYWLKIEKNVGINKMSAFIVDYLTIKTKDQVGSKNAYEIYRKYAEKSKMNNENLLKDLLHYSELYKTFLYGDNKYGKVINKKLLGLRTIEQTTVFPFLFQVFDDFLNGTFSEITILEDIVSFLFNYHMRRLICEVPSNSFKGLYKTLYNRVFSDVANKSKYYDAIVQFISELTTKDAIPSDTEVKEALLSKDIYHKKNVCKYLLKIIEETNDDGKENKEIAWGDKPITIEHVMPQKLTDEWKEELGEDFETTYTKFLHTLGNLTLTGYNSELGTKSFEEKKQVLSDNNTHIVVLNEDIMKAPIWNANSISARANKLSTKLLKTLAIKIPQTKVNFTSRNISKKSIFSAEDLIGTTPTSFILLGESVSINSYNGMLIAIANMLHGIDNNVLNELSETNYAIPYATRTYVSKDPDILRKPYEIGDSGIYIETNLSSKNIVSFIRALLDKFGLDDSDFVFFVKEQDEESENESTSTSAFDNASDKAISLYETLKNKALKIYPELNVQEKKLYVAFKINKNIFDVVLLKKGLKVYINLQRGELKDEKNFAEDCKEKGHWGNGDYFATISTDEEIDYLLNLIAQSIQKNK